jgi:hypothetical protein
MHRPLSVSILHFYHDLHHALIHHRPESAAGKPDLRIVPYEPARQVGRERRRQQREEQN